MNTEHAHLPRLPRLGAGEPDLQRMIDAASADGTPLMLLYLDIDHFRSINENMGVEVGDEALAILSDRLQQALGAEARAWRHGSDEFIVAVPRLPGTLPPERFGDLLREQIEVVVGEEYAALVELLGEMRTTLGQQVKAQNKRQQIYEAILNSDALALLRAGKADEARRRCAEIAKEFSAKAADETP